VTDVTGDFWWQREDLLYREGKLFLADEDLAHLARSAGTPCFAYSAPRVLDNMSRLHTALQRHQIKHSIYYALKANRYLPLLASLRLQGECGIDVCSPNELRLARQVGFHEREITYTGTSVSNQDLDIIADHPGVHINCDAISTLHRLGQRCPGREIGLRLNPQLSASHLEHISYGGVKASKFGIYPDRFEEALDVAKHYDMPVTTLHFHSASGYLNDELDVFQRILEQTDRFLRQVPAVGKVDIGGGLGVPLRPEDKTLDLDRWAALLADFVDGRGLEIQVEPGDYLVKDAGVLLVEVNTVEEKGGTLFVGVNAGFNLSNLAAYYAYPLIVAPLTWRGNSPMRKMSIVGNINEAIDVLAEDIELPEMAEGDLLALMNLGGYSVASSSNHCMRGDFSEYLITG
jgi:diaminopimelate decarboxylase